MSLSPSPIMRCPHCGTANRAGANFCNGCGTDLRESQTLSDLARQRQTRDQATSVEETDADNAFTPEEDSADSHTNASPTAGQHTDALHTGESRPTPPSISNRTTRGNYARDITEAESEPFDDELNEEPAGERPSPASVRTNAPNSEAPGDQPWLRLEFVPDDETSHDLDHDSEIGSDEHERMGTGTQGLLTPLRIATNITDDTPLPPRVTTPTVEQLSNDELRMIRGLMSEQPALVSYQVRPALAPPRPLRISWIFALLGLAIALPAFLLLGGPIGTPQRWTGVEDAYLTIQGVAPNTLVVVYWAYDPATAGELDLAMQPIMRHLLQRRARLAILTTMPGGIGSAERLIAQVRAAQGTGDLGLAADLAQPITFAYLPGGAASLPLAARAPARALIENIMVAAPDQREDLVPRPSLVVAAAANSEDVQAWLEQVQPLAPAPVIAVTAAGADPILRPYRASGQLSGLVSGFDGAYAYRRLLDPFIAPELNLPLLQQIVLQNWGHFALLAVIALGNLAALLGREGSA